MTTRNLEQAEQRIKHLEALLIQQVGRRGESDAVRKRRWEDRVIEAKCLGQTIPAALGGIYTDPVWLETGEVL